MESLTAKDFMMIQAKRDWKSVALNKTYWVTEWSWSPICDGIYPHQQTLRYEQIFHFFDETTKSRGRFNYFCPIYQTGTNNRFYFPWEIFDTERDAKIASEIYNSWAYDYDCSRNNVLKELISLSGCSFMDKSIDGIF